MTDVRKEFEKLLGYKPHWKMGDEKMQSLMDAYLKKHPNPVVEVEAPPLEPSQLDTPVVPDTRTPEQIEQDIINEAAASVPEFIPVPEKVEVTEEKAKEMAETVSDNPLMTAMAMLLTSQTRTNELLEQMNKNLQNNIVPIDQRVTPPEALKNLTEAQEKAPLTTQKRFKVLILRADLTASD